MHMFREIYLIWEILVKHILTGFIPAVIPPK